jgi:UDP-N-acetylmuramyl pentapeptide phosphotransferase/UDP-N-acetylglucosamine-1-phosphate transferase
VTAFEVLLAGSAAAAGVVVASIVRRRVLDRPSERLMRTNLRGRRVPAVLGIPVVIGGVAGLVAVAFVDRRGDNVVVGRVGLAVFSVIAVMALAGLVDDLRGDEAARGFKGHIAAALRGRLTGGAVKIFAGATAGLIAGFLIAPGRIAVEIALIVALTSNLINLLDRAPGRAAKVSAVVALPVFIVCRPSWGISSAGLWAALLACLPADLRERGMLGDTGANPVGGVLGLGLALTFAEAGRLIVLGFLLGLNAASEKTSFSGVIERNPFLKWLDGLGRR